MKKIVALAFGICLMGGAVSAQTLDSKYGLDSVKNVGECFYLFRIS